MVHRQTIQGVPFLPTVPLWWSASPSWDSKAREHIMSPIEVKKINKPLLAIAVTAAFFLVATMCMGAVAAAHVQPMVIHGSNVSVVWGNLYVYQGDGVLTNAQSGYPTYQYWNGVLYLNTWLTRLVEWGNGNPYTSYSVEVGYCDASNGGSNFHYVTRTSYGAGATSGSGDFQGEIIFVTLNPSNINGVANETCQPNYN